jgi:hypothetical protein
MAETTKIVHRFRLDELRDVSQGDQKNQSSGGSIYFTVAMQHTRIQLPGSRVSKSVPQGRTRRSNGYSISHLRTVSLCSVCFLQRIKERRYYQWQKAIKAGDIPTSKKICAVEHGHAYECRELGKSITSFNKQDWGMKRAAMIETGVFCRFWSPDPSFK